MSWQDVSGLIGAIGGTIGTIAAFLVYLQSGSRVILKVSLGIQNPGINVGPGQVDLIQIDPRRFSGSFGHGLDYSFARLVLIVEARNVGRLAVNAESLKLNRGKVEYGGGNLFQGAHTFPHRLDFGTSAIWMAPFEDAMTLATIDFPDKKRRKSVGAVMKLGNGRLITSHNKVSAAHLDDVQAAWLKIRAQA